MLLLLLLLLRCAAGEHYSIGAPDPRKPVGVSAFFGENKLYTVRDYPTIWVGLKCLWPLDHTIPIDLLPVQSYDSMQNLIFAIEDTLFYNASEIVDRQLRAYMRLNASLDLPKHIPIPEYLHFEWLAYTRQVVILMNTTVIDRMYVNYDFSNLLGLASNFIIKDTTLGAPLEKIDTLFVMSNNDQLMARIPINGPYMWYNNKNPQVFKNVSGFKFRTGQLREIEPVKPWYIITKTP